MLAPPESETTGKLIRLDLRILGAFAIIVFAGGMTIAWIVGQLGVPFLDPNMIVRATILIAMILVCCSTLMVFGQFTARLPKYGIMEIRFKEGMEFYKNQDWESALKIFREQMGPEMNHKRALFYGAKCCEKLDDLNCVKEYTKKYLELQPKDKEAWEMLANAHKHLFEYEESEYALNRASEL
ncbi:MAG: hypothetical protein ACXABV_06415 [Candidatus Thorarchaeota archaeon]|jgi:tetratricopeptide (TPR) repeat protein